MQRSACAASGSSATVSWSADDCGKIRAQTTKIRLLQNLTTLSFLATNCPDNWSFEVVRFELLPHVQLAAPRQCVKVAVVALILSPVSTRLHSVSSSTENYNCCESTNLLYRPLVSCCEDGLFRHFNQQLKVIFPGDSGSEAAMKRVLFWGFETEKSFEVLEKLEKTAAGSSSSLTLLTTILPAGSGMFIFGLFLKKKNKKVELYFPWTGTVEIWVSKCRPDTFQNTIHVLTIKAAILYYDVVFILPLLKIHISRCSPN